MYNSPSEYYLESILHYKEQTKNGDAHRVRRNEHWVSTAARHPPAVPHTLHILEAGHGTFVLYLRRHQNAPNGDTVLQYLKPLVATNNTMPRATCY